jgi:hypothetical protein
MARQGTPHPVSNTQMGTSESSNTVSQHLNVDSAFGLCISLFLGNTDSHRECRDHVRLAL